LIELHKPVYIPSIEASDIYNHMFRGRDLDLKYIGMIPTSLELNKLISFGIKTFKKKTNDKFLSNDIINVKFKQRVDSGPHIVKKLESKITTLDEGKNDYKHKLEEFIKVINSEINEEKWQGVSYNDLRLKLYSEGFVYNKVKYVPYKRSSAKSRIGQVLFIKEKLYEPMIKWSRMKLEFRGRPKEDKIDYPSLLAYESLVGSSIESVLEINPNNILIVDDVESIFSQKTSVVRTGDDGYLDSFTEESKIKNSLFDGESLLDERYFHDGKSMVLLRNHMFKSAAFNCKIQDFLKDNCPEGILFDDWKIPSMFKNDYMFAKDIHLIITPSSLKALKFSSILGTEKRMWDHWKKIITFDKCIFGVCKSEKSSKRGYDEYGNVLQQISYQMLNSLPFTQSDISKLTIFEKTYIDKLKNDDRFFIEYIKKNANDMNSNAMFADLYLINNDLINTKVFRNFRKNTISSYVTHIKNGKIRLSGDYCVILGNPLEFLHHSIGLINAEDPNSIALQNNEVYTKLFDEKEITGFRNPHTSPSNVLLAKNINAPEIDMYFNLSDNIVCVNAIRFPLQDILSGSDYDSDTVLLSDNEQLLSVAKRASGKYNVCLNNVLSSKKQYRVCSRDMAIIDNELSNSQKYIGRTVNTGQLCMSRYWDMYHQNICAERLNSLMKKIDVVTVLSGICIDLAKKMFDININKEIDNISKYIELKKEKPLFWKYVSQSDDVLTTCYKCPMDFLFNEMQKLPMGNRKNDIPFDELLVKKEMSKSNRKQEQIIYNYIESMNTKINNTYARQMTEKERDRKIDDIIKYYSFFIRKLSVGEDTMYSMMSKLTKNKKDSIASRLLNTLYSTKKEQFFRAFLSKNTTL
jgi:hypothetical protein